MIDHLKLHIPVDDSLVSSVDGKYCITDFDLFDLDLNIGSRSVYRNEDGEIKNSALYCPYESLPTSFTTMAMKFRFESAFTHPYVELKVSPAKILQGHNVFGSDDIASGAFEMLAYLQEAFPSLYGILAIQSTEVMHIDVTYSSRLKDNEQVVQVIDYLRKVSANQTRTGVKQYDSTVTWGSENTRLVKHKAYAKYLEFIHQLKEYQKRAPFDDSAKRVVSVMSDPRLQDWASGLLRFESRLMKRWLQRRDIPTNLFALVEYQRSHPDFVRDSWISATKDIFSSLEGHTMKMTDDDSVYAALQKHFYSVTKTGRISYAKANTLFHAYCAIREHGLDVLKSRYSDRRCQQFLKDLKQIGLSRAFLQNLHSRDRNNIVPLLRFINVDFNNQLPDWYQPPVSKFAA